MSGASRAALQPPLTPLPKTESYYDEDESSKSGGGGGWERGNVGTGAPLPQLRQEGAEAGTDASWEHLF